MANTYTVLGMMSGSSLDGVDLALCTFKTDDKNQWSYTINEAETIPYDKFWLNTLIELPRSTGAELIEKDLTYGKHLGNLAKGFLEKYNLSADFLASHGHTIFHQPEKHYTFQLGNGQAIAVASGIQTISDFRTKDILLGGQGAPLVPIGDEILFSDYDICLNLGGIANISYKKHGKRLAHDVCPANQLLNYLSKQLGFEFDRDGDISIKGILNDALLKTLNQNNYYKLPAPKSLSNQFVQNSFIEALEKFNETAENKLRSCTEHIISQIDRDTKRLPKGKILITGGGAHNLFLIKKLIEISEHEIIIPDEKLVDFKEALIFAFMGVFRFRNEINCLSSVTGAASDCCSGSIFNP